MGTSQSNVKNILLFGDKDSGKTLMLYQMQSNIKLESELIKPTYGFNYEEISVNNVQIGIFDLSGDLKQYELVNIITKSVDICGIIFVVAMDKLDELDKSRELLDIILGNNYINDRLSLLIIYNKKNVGERLNWMDESTLDHRMNVHKLKKKYNIVSFHSRIIDVSDSLKPDDLEKLLVNLHN